MRINIKKNPERDTTLRDFIVSPAEGRRGGDCGGCPAARRQYLSWMKCVRMRGS